MFSWRQYWYWKDSIGTEKIDKFKKAKNNLISINKEDESLFNIWFGLVNAESDDNSCSITEETENKTEYISNSLVIWIIFYKI